MPKLSTCIFIPKEFGVIKADAEFFCDSIRVIGHIIELLLYQGSGCFLHGGEGGLARFLICVLIKEYLRFKDLALGRSQTKLRVRYDLTGTFADAHVANRKLAAVTPIGIKRRVFIVRWNAGQIIQHTLDLDFANPLDECFERFILLTLANVSTCESLYHFGDTLRWYGAHCQTIRTRVVSPFTA